MVMLDAPARWFAALLVLLAGVAGVALTAGLTGAALVDLALHHRYGRDLAALAVSGCAWLLVWYSVRRGIIRRTGP